MYNEEVLGFLSPFIGLPSWLKIKNTHSSSTFLWMEDLWKNWISYLEMNGQSHNNSLDEDNLFQTEFLPNFSFQSVKCSSTISNNNVFPTTSTMGSSNLSYDEGHRKMLKSNSSNSIISHDVASHMPNAPCSSTFIMSFGNSTVEPIPNNSPNFGGEASCSSLLSSKSTLNSKHDVKNKPKGKQGTKKSRSSTEIKDHIMAERKRRQELSERFIALSATIPGLKKTDKSYILREAITYVKQLQERVNELENQNKRKRASSNILIKKSQVYPIEKHVLCETNMHRCTPPIPQVQARVLENEVLIGIHCHKQKDIMLKVMSLLQNLHLSLARSSVLPFGTSILKVTIIAQMGDKYCMTVNDLVRTLREDLVKSH